MDLAELCPVEALEKLNPELEQKYVIMPGLEVARARRKVVTDIFQWVDCYAVYVAVFFLRSSQLQF